VTDPHDDLDAWLHAEVDPLQPPPGTFQQIRKQARRRKARRAAVSAVSAGTVAAVIVLAVVALPKVVPSVLHLKPDQAGHSVAAGGTRPPTAFGSGSRAAASSPSKAAGSTTDTPASGKLPGSLPPVPASFQPTSATFVGLNTGWVIGQAGTPGQCYTRFCTSVARTDTAGKVWYGVHAPRTGAPNGATGVSQIRFLDTRDGWAFGPQLWATHDGGQTWTQVPTNGLRVTDLETAGSEAFAVFARCTGTGSGFADGCTQFFLYSSPAGSDAWAPVPGLSGGFGTGGAGSGGTAGSATVVLAAGRGYFYTPAGTLVSGPVTGGGAWTQVGSGPLHCLPGPAAAGGRPAAGQLAAYGAAGTDLALACPASTAGGQPGSTLDQQETIYSSADGGQNWRQAGTLTTTGPATSLAAANGGLLVLGTSLCIDVSAGNGAKWRQTQLGPGQGFSYVGMTSPAQGVAVPADASLNAVWFTFDGAQSWQASAIKGG
jgi:hypothetical protein